MIKLLNNIFFTKETLKNKNIYDLTRVPSSLHISFVLVDDSTGVVVGRMMDASFGYSSNSFYLQSFL